MYSNPPDTEHRWWNEDNCSKTWIWSIPQPDIWEAFSFFHCCIRYHFNFVFLFPLYMCGDFSFVIHLYILIELPAIDLQNNSCAFHCPFPCEHTCFRQMHWWYYTSAGIFLDFHVWIVLIWAFTRCFIKVFVLLYGIELRGAEHLGLRISIFRRHIYIDIS